VAEGRGAVKREGAVDAMRLARMGKRKVAR
jgi:hypothetical protein